MIKVNELKVGNIISHGIIENGHYLTLSIDLFAELLAEPKRLEKLIPIPLTPEILERCGFEKAMKKENYISYRICGFRNVRIYNNYIICTGDGIRLKYLHQLQNLYFALTEIELKVNL